MSALEPVSGSEFTRGNIRRFHRSDTPPSCEPGFAREAGDALEYVHDGLAEREEGLGWEVLGKEICQVVVGADERDADGMVFHDFADVEMSWTGG